MSDVKHTPGPWEAAFYDTHEFEIHDPTDGTALAVVPIPTIQNGERVGANRERSIEEIGANARLIAASPDLLAACKAAVAAFDRADRESRPFADNWADLREAAEVARGVIAEAEGNGR
jgi:hypothetical protein